MAHTVNKKNHFLWENIIAAVVVFGLGYYRYSYKSFCCGVLLCTIVQLEEWKGWVLVQTELYSLPTN